MDESVRTYLREVFNCDLEDLTRPGFELTLECIQENAWGGFELDQKILQELKERGGKVF